MINEQLTTGWSTTSSMHPSVTPRFGIPRLSGLQYRGVKIDRNGMEEWSAMLAWMDKEESTWPIMSSIAGRATAASACARRAPGGGVGGGWGVTLLHSMKILL